jgi:F0F1-type ATP synthase membrane subunit c/vacuolar-type H+-ATPase subunit K
MRRALVVVALFALGAACAIGYLGGSWHVRTITEAAARAVIEDFSAQISVLEGRVIALSDVCR